MSTTSASGANTKAILSNKVAKVLSASSRVTVDSSDIINSLKALSDLSAAQARAGHVGDAGTNSSSQSDEPASFASLDNGARRNLLSVLERRSVKTHEALLSSVSGIIDQIDSMNDEALQLATECDTLTSRLESARTQTAHLVEQTAELHRQKEIVAEKHQLVSAFLDRFQVSEEDILSLESDAVDEEFFAALHRLLAMREDCKQLLQSYHQRVGLDIMDSHGKRIEKAFEKLYFWVQKESRSLNAAAPEVGPTFVRALHLLRQRKAYYNHCCQEIYQARRVLLIRRFIEALTRGGTDGESKPIELHAYDPVRYTSDMLAWVHQNAASEKEFLASVLDESVEEDFAKQLLGDTMQGVSRPLKVRVEQALRSQSSSVVCYQISHVLAFYCSTLSNMISVESRFYKDLSDLRLLAETRFFESIEEQSSRLISHPPPVTHDLSPPRVISELLLQLEQLMSIYKSSFVPDDQRMSEFQPVLAAVLDPLEQIISNSCTSLDASDTAIYFINILQAVEDCIRKYDFTSSRLEILSLLISNHKETLIHLQSSLILKKSGLALKLEILSHWSTNLRVNPDTGAILPLSSVDGMDTSTLMSSLQSFYKSLFGIGAFTMPQCDRLFDTNVREEVRQRICRNISQSYILLYEAVSDRENKYESVQDILTHTPSQIDTLLDLQ